MPILAPSTATGMSPSDPVSSAKTTTNDEKPHKINEHAKPFLTLMNLKRIIEIV